MTAAEEALEENGHEVISHSANFRTDETLHGSHTFDSPESAFEQAIQSIAEQDIATFYLQGENVAEALQGERDFIEVFYTTIEPSIEVNEPVVDRYANREEKMREPAFGLNIKYHWQPNDENYFETEALRVHAPYTEEDARKQIQEINQILTEYGFRTEEGIIHGRDRGPNQETDLTTKDII